MREIHADYDRDTIVVYQAYNDAIADAALKAGRFVPPFSWKRMTWIKPSLLWLMARSNWGQKPNQHRILAVRISREGWDRALSEGVLTAYTPGAHQRFADWEAAFQSATVHIQWDPERSLRGAVLQQDSIQVGLSRACIRDFTDEWTRSIQDITAQIKKIRTLRDRGRARDARRLLPQARRYPVPRDVARRLNINIR
ncbi:MAG: DUF4291 domain-containing protein [Myxococcota bacterium]